MSDGAQRNQLVIGTRHVNVIQLLRVQAVYAFNLWNDFIAQSFHVEPVNVIAADAGREIGANLLHVESHRGNFVMIENDLRLGLVDLGVDVAELKHVRLHCLLENLLGKFQDAFLIGGGSNDKANGKVV